MSFSTGFKTWKSIRLFQVCAVSALLWIAMIVSGCGLWKPSVPPLTADQLIAMTPETCTTALVFPSFDGAYQALLLLLDRAAPENVDVEVEAQVVARPLATMAGEPDATDIIDIAMAKGIDPAQPLALYLGSGTSSASLDASTQETLPSGVVNPAALIKQIIEQRPFVAVLPRYSQKYIEQAVEDWSKGKGVREEALAGIEPGLRIREDGRLCWFFTPEGIVIGNSADLAKEVAARRQQPADIPHDAEATATADLIQIVRGTKTPSDDQRETGPLAVTADLLGALLDAGEDGVPTVVTWRVGESALEATARRPADTNNAPALPRLAPLLPSDANGFVALPLSDEGVSMVQGMVGGLGMSDSLPGDAQSLLESMSGELAVATTEGASGRPNVVVLTHLKTGKAQELLESAATALTVEMYNGVRIVSVPVPGDSGYEVQYALLNDTLAAATQMGDVKTAIDRLQSGKPSGLFTKLDPPLDPAAPPSTAIVAKTSFFSDVFVPLLSQRGAFPSERVKLVESMFAKVQELRITSNVEDKAKVTRLSVRVQ
ncbi:MAG: hypothetical protein K1Y02_15595 [Candidatus Hydrogenedentes bacterium]|nr:hypothetical protein [Candidatus Hydrogenedentota bacterium]